VAEMNTSFQHIAKRNLRHLFISVRVTFTWVSAPVWLSTLCRPNTRALLFFPWSF